MSRSVTGFFDLPRAPISHVNSWPSGTEGVPVHCARYSTVQRMSTKIDFSDLLASLSSSATLTFPTEENFASGYANWTDFNVQTPLAVVKPSVEADIVATIRFAGAHHLRVAVRGGGHSAFNTIAGGLLVDLSGYKAATYDEASRRLTVRGGITNGEALSVLAKNGRCARL